MLKNLFNEKAPVARIPDGMRIYAIGDIHGSSDLLGRLLQMIALEERSFDGEVKLVFLGDYIDRGADSRGVVDRLIALSRARPGTVFLKGNHEAIALDFLKDPAEASAWFEWGGLETLASYGVRGAALRDLADASREFRKALPREHLAFLEALETIRIIGDYVFVHAGVKPGAPLDKQEERDLLWIRGEFHNTPAGKRPNKVVIHGHQPVRKALDAGWRVDVDTGACYSGHLTAAVLEGDKRRFIST